jgi:hypothetical protein
MRIEEKRNVVFPVVTGKITKKVDEKDVTEDVVSVYAYHTPVSREVFEANYRVMAATKASLYSKGNHYLMISGPRVAALTLRDEGKKDAAARGLFDDEGKPRDDDTQAFFAEVKRLTTILCPGPNGWDMLPVDAAISSGKIDAEDWEEVEAAIVFFSCHSAMARKAEREDVTRRTASLLSALITSSTLTEYVASLPTLMPAAPTTKAQSSIPS